MKSLTVATTKTIITALTLLAMTLASNTAFADSDNDYNNESGLLEESRPNNNTSNTSNTGITSTGSTTRPLNFIVDKHYSMVVGSDLAQSALWGYQLFDDSMISSTEGDTQPQTMFARFGKSLIEYTLANWVMVAQHEWFGHGARAREFDLSNVHYKVRPYSGYTSFSQAQYNQLTPAQKIALTTGGMESTSLLASDLRENFLHGSAVDIRAAQLYVTSYLDQSLYVFGTSDSDTNLGNDITSYISSVNAWQNINGATITKRNLRHRSNIDFLDPFLFYSIFGIVNYIATGEQQYDFYMIPIAGFKYLPSFRNVLAPWGPEWQFNNYIKNPADQLLYIGLRNGKTGNQLSTAITVKISELLTWNNVYFDARADLWKQPNIKAVNLATAKSKLGLAAFSTANFKLNSTMKIFGQLGYKTAGFIPGEALKSSLIARAGVGFSL